MTNKIANNLLAYDFVGKEIYVCASDCKSLVSKQGTIINETKNLFVIESQNKQLRLSKAQIRFKIKGSDLEIDGKKILKTPDERLKSSI
jgi:RNase P/RNase MRP subunit p29